MPTITIKALAVKNRLIPLTDKQAGQYLPEAVKTFTFDHNPCQGAHLVAVGQRVASVGLYDQYGRCDPTAEAALRSQVLAEKLLTGWSRKDDDNNPLPVEPTTIATLHTDILLELGKRLEGETVSAADVAELKKPTPPSTQTA